MTATAVVILGASRDRSKFGNKSVRAHQQAGYDVLPVNPHTEEIEGLTAYPSLSALPPRHYDRISVYLPPAVSMTLLDEIAALDAGEVWLNPGSDSPELLAHAQALNVPAVQGCSIVALGLSPDQFPD